VDFYNLELSDNILDALDDMRFESCTPIQEKCIPEILDGRDIIGVAQTGTGKTAAYLLPILSLLDEGGFPKDAINCIVMSPTRELAQQIDQAMQGFSYYLNDISSVAVYGGNDGNRYDQEKKSLALGADVIIATPGRLISHLSLGNIDMSHVSFFVLDEADRMLDMGFNEDITQIKKYLPDNCQTILFSATMPKKIQELAQSLLHDPIEVKLSVSKPAEKIKQSAYVCYETQKIGIIKHLVQKNKLKRVIIFSGSKMKVKDIQHSLVRMKINSGEMHSDLSQAERDDIMYKFKSGQIDILVATDIVARGIDIDDITMVINYDVPHDSEDYVHRIGRTARADRDGIAITFISDTEVSDFKQIEKFLGKEVEKTPIPEEMGEGPAYVSVPNHRYGSIKHGNHGNVSNHNNRNRQNNGNRQNKKVNAQKGDNPKQRSNEKNIPNDRNNAKEKTSQNQG